MLGLLLGTGLGLASLAWPLSDKDAAGVLSRFEFVETHMGSSFKVLLYCADEPTARRASRAAFDRIAALDSDSERLPAGERAFPALVEGRGPSDRRQCRPVRRARTIEETPRADRRSLRRDHRARGPTLAAGQARAQAA